MPQERYFTTKILAQEKDFSIIHKTLRDKIFDGTSCQTTLKKQSYAKKAAGYGKIGVRCKDVMAGQVTCRGGKVLTKNGSMENIFRFLDIKIW